MAKNKVVAKRTEINFSKKLDAAVEKFEKAPCDEKYDYPSNYLNCAGVTTYGDHDTNSAIEEGFSMAINCPPDKTVFSGYSETSETRYFVYASDEEDALKVWAACVKEARAEAKKHPV